MSQRVLTEGRWPSAHVRPSAVQRGRWREARRFQMQAQKELARCHVPFVMWLLLETLAELIGEASDAVQQGAVGERAGLSRMVTAYWMDRMSEDGLVDRGPAMDGRAYRIWLSEMGAETLRECNERLLARGVT